MKTLLLLDCKAGTVTRWLVGWQREGNRFRFVSFELAPIYVNEGVNGTHLSVSMLILWTQSDNFQFSLFLCRYISCTKRKTKLLIAKKCFSFSIGGSMARASIHMARERERERKQPYFNLKHIIKVKGQIFEWIANDSGAQNATIKHNRFLSNSDTFIIVSRIYHAWKTMWNI